MYRSDIDGLRAFSIIAVVLYHAFPKVLPGGFVGVDVFFVISGYLITAIILASLKEESFSVADFYKRRIQRIVPALLLVLAFCLLAGWFVLLPLEYAALGKHTGAAAVFSPNILYWTESGYFDTDSKLKPLLHLWSLGVEEQFYLLWPMLLVLLTTRLRVPPTLLIGSALIGSFALSILYIGDRAASFFLPQFRVWEMLLGALLAALHLRSDVSNKSPGTFDSILPFSGIALMCTATLVITNAKVFPGWWALLPTIGAVLVIASSPKGWANRFLLGNRTMVFIGKISFPLYLWHWPLLSMARIMESGEPAIPIKLAAVTLSVLLAWLSYRFVERALRYHQGRAVPLVLLLSLLALGAAGMAISLLEGLPHRTDEINRSAAQLEWDSRELLKQHPCPKVKGRPGYCFSDGKTPQVAVIGDSHSQNIFFALAHHYRDSTVGVLQLGRGNCPPLYGVVNSVFGDDDYCLSLTMGNMDWVLDNPDIQTVYLSSMGPMYLHNNQERYDMSFVESPAVQGNYRVFDAGLKSSIRRAQKAGKEVVVVIDWPDLGFLPEKCIDIRPVRLSTREAQQCRSPIEDYERKNKTYRNLLVSVGEEFPSLKYWDTPALFCEEGYCYGARDGIILYRNRGHLSMSGSQYLGEHLLLENLDDIR